MNTKKLYQADGYAVKELLKVTAVLYNAVKTNADSYDPSNEESSSLVSFDVSSKVNNTFVHLYWFNWCSNLHPSSKMNTQQWKYVQ